MIMKISLKIALYPVLLGFITITSMAQKGVEDGSRYGHGEDSVRCIKNLSLYREYVKHGDYPMGLGPWRVVFDECPKSTKNIYIDGAKMFNDFVTKEKDPERKAILMDSLRIVYDQRIKYYKQRGSVLGRKAVDILKHPEYRTDPDIQEETYAYLQESISILKNKSSVAVVATYMTTSFALFQNERLTDMEVIENYAQASEILDYQLEQKPGDKTILQVKEATDYNFITSGAPTCESLVAYFQPLWDAKKADVAYLGRAVNFLSALECESEPFFALVAEALYEIEPSAQAAFGLAKLFLSKEDYNKAVTYYKEAINAEQDPVKKGDYLYQLAYITNTELNQPEKARTLALEAIELKPDWGEPYILIGDAYVGSKNCFSDEFEKTTIYWAAVDQFNKARSVDAEVADKANERISTYKKYFPDIETIFFYSLKEGDNYKVGCWINETTKVRARE
jgi:tetratricopeptide (TPR) repeat protein